MKVKTSIKAGGISPNHNERLVRDAAKATGLNRTKRDKQLKAKRLKIKTGVKVGGLGNNHNETFVRAK